MTMMTDQDTDRKQESQMARSKVRGARRRPTEAATSEENVENVEKIVATTPKKRIKRTEDPESLTPTRMQALRARLGPSGSYAVWLAVSAALTALVLMGLYMVVVWVATQMVPAAMTITAAFLGVPLLTLSMETALVYWIAPNVFLLIVMAGLMLWFVRTVWNWRARRVEAMRRFFVGKREDKVVPPMGTAVLRSSKDSKRLKNEENN